MKFEKARSKQAAAASTVVLESETDWSSTKSNKVLEPETDCPITKSNIVQESQTDWSSQAVPQFGTIVDCLKRRAEEFRDEMNNWLVNICNGYY